MPVNASSFPAPSAATIAAAVAAPSSATIATAVAAAVPTLAQINTSVATNSPSPFNWVHLGTGSLQNVSSATVSFSSYKYIRIVWNAQTGANTQAARLRFNGDTGGNYSYGFFAFRQSAGNNTGSNQRDAAQIVITPGTILNGQNFSGWCEIFNAAATTFKPYQLEAYNTEGSSSNGEQMNLTGAYRGTSAITSVTLVDVNGNLFQNDSRNQFQVYGAN